jgi:hypothetical protein
MGNEERALHLLRYNVNASILSGKLGLSLIHLDPPP